MAETSSTAEPHGPRQNEGLAVGSNASCRLFQKKSPERSFFCPGLMKLWRRLAAPSRISWRPCALAEETVAFFGAP